MNLENAQKAVAIASKVGASVEAELGSSHTPFLPVLELPEYSSAFCSSIKLMEYILMEMYIIYKIRRELDFRLCR